MNQLILLGGNRDDPMADFLFKNLSRRFCVTCCTGERVLMRGSGRELLFLFYPELRAAEGKRGLYLACAGRPLPEGLFLPEGAAVIVSSEEEGQLRELSRLGARAVTCGLSGKDTVTFSSREEGRAVISLMREVTGPAGIRVEPMDLPVNIPKGVGDYPILACGAALMLLGGVSETGKEKFFQT